MYEIYGKPSCKFCEMAKQTLDDRFVSYRYIDVSQDEKSLGFLKSNNFRSVPQIYHNGNHIGGFQELQQYLKENT